MPAAGKKNRKNTRTKSTTDIRADEEECLKCSRTDGDDWIECDRCSKWTHADCAKIPREVFKYISTSDNIVYMCDICWSRPIDKPAIAWEETDKRLKLIEQKLERVVQVVDKPPSVLSGSDTRPQKPQQPDPSCFNGIRIQNLKEPDHELSSDNMESDMAGVRTILNDLCGEEATIADLYRTGNKKENVTRPRTLIVKLPNYWQYRKVLARTHKLKDSSDNVFISHELTKIELELEKSLLKCRYELIQSGQVANENAKIRGLKLFINGQEHKLD